MEKDFLGRGWALSDMIDDNRQIAMSQYEQDIREAILIILSTSKGERMMRPDFGCGINDFVFSIVNTATLALIEHHIREAILKWEPRVEILTVSTSTEDLTNGQLMIDISYKIHSTNAVNNLVYPFYIKEGQG